MDAISIIDAHGAGRQAGFSGRMAAARAGTQGSLEVTGGAQALHVDPNDRAGARKAAEAFEAQFLGQMFQLAMKDMPIDEVFGGGPGERVFRDMLTNAWAESAVKAGGVGIADSVMRTLIAAQGGETS